MSGTIELHCHLDGSVRPDTIEDLARDQGITLPRPARELATIPPDCTDLATYIAAIDVALDVLQTPEALERAARELVEDWRADGVVHGEARFAPELHTRRGLGLDEVVAAVAAGLEAGSGSTGVSTALIVCCMRPSAPSVSWAVVEAAVRAPAAVALDVAGAEVGHDLRPHAAAFRAGAAEGLRITVHAGEEDGADMMWSALDDLGAERIGHGVKAVADPALVDRLVRDGAALEMCPTSNLQTGVVGRPSAHPADRLLRHGVAVTISTDARTVSGVTLADERALLAATFGWGDDEWRACQRNALTAAFVDDRARAALDHRITGPARSEWTAP